jgi:hypothetical protein
MASLLYDSGARTPEKPPSGSMAVGHESTQTLMNPGAISLCIRRYLDLAPAADRDIRWVWPDHHSVVDPHRSHCGRHSRLGRVILGCADDSLDPRWSLNLKFSFTSRSAGPSRARGCAASRAATGAFGGCCRQPAAVQALPCTTRRRRPRSYATLGITAAGTPVAGLAAAAKGVPCSPEELHWQWAVPR